MSPEGRTDGEERTRQTVGMLSRFRGVAAGATILILAAAAALVGCTAPGPGEVQQSETSVPTATTEPEAAAPPTPEASEQEECTGLSEVYSSAGSLYLKRRGALRDLGAREFARGEVTLGEDGRPLTYAVSSPAT